VLKVTEHCTLKGQVCGGDSWKPRLQQAHSLVFLVWNYVVIEISERNLSPICQHIIRDIIMEK